MRRRGNLGLLFGPRESGCWEFLLAQAWGFCLITAAIGWFSGSQVAWKVSRSFLFEGLGITLLLLSVAQVCWVGERFPQIPGGCYNALFYLLVGSSLGMILAGVISSPDLAAVAFGGLTFLLGVLLLSVLTRILLAIWQRLRGRQPEDEGP